MQTLEDRISAVLRNEGINVHRVKKLAKRIEKNMARPKPDSRIKDLEKQLSMKDGEIGRLKASISTYCNRSTEYRIDSDCKISYAAIGDTHIGSNDSNLEALKKFYERADEYGVERVFHTGDVMDGYHMHPGMEFEQNALGFAAQLELVVKNYPKVKGLETLFISGNHDASFKKGAGVYMGEVLAQRRHDMIFLGEDTAYVTFETKRGDKKFHLLHPDGGTAYAISYKPQKVVDAYPGGAKPDVLLMGHFHKAEWLPSYRNVSCFQTGTLQHQTPYMARKATPAHEGGWIATNHFGNYTNEQTVTFVSYYEDGVRNEKKIKRFSG